MKHVNKIIKNTILIKRHFVLYSHNFFAWDYFCLVCQLLVFAAHGLRSDCLLDFFEDLKAK